MNIISSSSDRLGCIFTSFGYPNNPPGNVFPTTRISSDPFMDVVDLLLESDPATYQTNVIQYVFRDSKSRDLLTAEYLDQTSGLKCKVLTTPSYAPKW